MKKECKRIATKILGMFALVMVMGLFSVQTDASQYEDEDKEAAKYVDVVNEYVNETGTQVGEYTLKEVKSDSYIDAVKDIGLIIRKEYVARLGNENTGTMYIPFSFTSEANSGIKTNNTEDVQSYFARQVQGYALYDELGNNGNGYALDVEQYVYQMPETYYKNGVYHGTIMVKYNYLATKENYKEAQRVAEEVLNSLNLSGCTDVEKVAKIAQWTEDNIEYQTGTNIYTWKVPKGHSDFTYTMIERIGECRNYAAVFSYLCNHAGVPTVNLRGSALGDSHEWNAVRIDGKWYEVEPQIGDERDILFGTASNGYGAKYNDYKTWDEFVQILNPLTGKKGSLEEDSYWKENSECNGNHNCMTGYCECTGLGCYVVKGYYCYNCPYVDYRVEEKDEDHNYTTKGTVVQEVSCTQPEITRYTCKYHEDKYKDEETKEALGHTYESVKVDPTCSEDGYTGMKCTRCGDIVDKVVLPAMDTENGCIYDEGVITKEATCTETGVKTYTCSKCGGTKEETIKKASHDYELISTKYAATCETNGTGTYTCKDCGETHLMAIKATGHDYQTVKVGKTCTHSAGTQKKCANCGRVKSSSYTKYSTEHTWDDGVITKEATCTALGVKTYTCTKCKDTKEEKLPMIDHTWDEGTVTKAATCGNEGEKTYKCTVCKNKKTETIPQHFWKEEGTTVKNPTCTESGEIDYECERCDEIKKEEIPALGHTLDEGVVTKEPTCESEGLKVYTCTICGEEQEEVLDKTSHAFDEGVVTKESTCFEEGVKTYTCSVCGETKEESIPKTEHKYDEGVVTKEATCLEEGTLTYTCETCGQTKTEVLDKVDHDFKETSKSDATCEANSSTTYACSMCGEEKTVENEDTALGHDWNDGEVTKEATCTEKGLKVYTCKRCDLTKEEEISATGHQNLEERNAKESTCTTKGYTGDTYCKDCNALVEEGSEIAINSKNHVWDDGVVEREATTFMSGAKKFTCTECGTTKSSVIPSKHEHNGFSEEVTKKATCTEQGEVTKTCNTCGFSEVEYTDPLGHKVYETNKVNVKDATCKENGYTGDILCARCGEVAVKGEVTPTTDHKWDSGVVTKKATCLEEGVLTYTCRVCEETKTETIPVTDTHNTERKVVKESTCSEEGEAQQICKDCGKVVETSKTSKKAHDYEITSETDSTCSKNGSVTEVCTVCGDTITTSKSTNNRHSFGGYSNLSSATVLKKATRVRTCKDCGKREVEEYGNKLSATISTNASSLVLKTKQKTTKFTVSFAEGDSVTSWNSSNSKIFTVTGNSNGTCTIKAGSKTGKATLTITLKSGLTKKVTVKVQKKAVAASKITVTSKKVTLSKGQKFSLNANVAPITVTSKTKYKSSKTSVAKVNGSGVITAKKKGKATITVTNGKKKVKVTVVVK